MNTGISNIEIKFSVFQTFIETVRSGKAKLIDVDDWVEKWHTGEGFGLELREYLGFSKELYGAWMRNGDDALIGLV